MGVHGDPRWGLDVGYLSTSDTATAYAVSERPEEDECVASHERLATVAARVLAMLDKVEAITEIEIRKFCALSADDLKAVLNNLARAGDIRKDGTGPQALYSRVRNT